jgi:uncharacterized linocin/CFP29 family protein
VVEEDGEPLTVNDTQVLRLRTAAVYVHLKQQQMAQEKLEDAILVFRRAANLLARAEDAIVFNGLPLTDGNVPGDILTQRKAPLQCQVGPGEHDRGLYAEGQVLGKALNGTPANGGDLVTAMVTAVSLLEENGHNGPFACIMGMKAFVVAHTPQANSLVLPSDRIEPILGMALLRSGALDDLQVIVVALAGDPVDLVVGTAPVAQFLQVNNEAQYVFRVYERFALRIREDNSVCSFTLGPQLTAPAPKESTK